MAQKDYKLPENTAKDMDDVVKFQEIMKEFR